MAVPGVVVSRAMQLPPPLKEVPQLWSRRSGSMKRLSVAQRGPPRTPRTVHWMSSKSKTPKWTLLLLLLRLKGLDVPTMPQNLQVLHPLAKDSRRHRAMYKVNNLVKRGAPPRKAVTCHSNTTLPCACTESCLIETVFLPRG